MRSAPMLLLSALVANAGCSRGEPPSPDGIDTAVSPLPGPAVAPLSSAADAGADAAPRAPTSARTTTSAKTTAPDAGDPGSLPQTRDRPRPSSNALDARAAALWDAIVHDDPDRGMPFFFPVSAYAQVKAVTSPEADWRRRLVAAYERDVHGLAKRLGEKAESAKLVRIEIPDARARWVEPDEEWNKLGYWRVYGTRIVYEVDEKERSFEISSLISWRGEWYVVHLTGFK